MEIVSVIAVVLLLTLVAVPRLGRIRSQAQEVSCVAMSREFARGVDTLVANGSDILPTLVGLVATSENVDNKAKDPLYAGLDTKTFMLSSKASPNVALVTAVWAAVDTKMQEAALGRVKGSVSPGVFLNYNVTAVEAFENGKIRGFYLIFAP